MSIAFRVCFVTCTNADSSDQVFYAAVATAGLSIFGSAFLPWYSVKEKDKSKGADAAGENAFGGDGAAESAGVINPGEEPMNEK